MAQIISVRLNKPDHQPIGFRLQGGKDFGTPLVVQKVNGGSAAERAGLLAGDAVIQVNGTDVYNLRHQDAQDAIRHAGHNLEITVQRGGGTWRPAVTPTGSLPRPGKPLGAVSPVTQTSLKAPQQPSLAFGSGHNSVAKPFNYMNGSGDSVKSIVNKQYNTPVGMYSDETIAETLSAQTEVLAGGVLGVNFKKNEKTYDAEKSAVFKMLQEDSNDPEPESAQSPNSGPVSGLRHVTAPVAKPDAPINNTGGLPPGQNICEECERLIIGVFVRIKDKNLHVECFKCATCGTSLKNQGYYNLNGKLYCDIHAKLVARQNPPASNLEPVTIPPGSKFPSGTYSTPLSSHTTPLPPLSTNYNINGNSLFSSNETKPFGDSVDTPELKQQNVEAFTSLLHNGHESDNKNLSATGNGLLNISGKEHFLDNSVNEASPITSAFSTNSIVNSNTNSAYRKVIPPHMGGNYKPASNLSGPKPFGSSTFSGASPSLSPRSAPISPASTLPRAAPVAPVVPPPSQTTLQFTDKKTENGLSNANTDTLMRKMAKFALSNDYEIGIQRKIKPRDHIQNMADKIKDTVVLKHPLNTPPDYAQELNNSKLVSSPFNSRQSSPDDKTLRRQMKPSPKLMYNNFEIGVQRKIKPGDHISSMADKIKDTIVSKHPTNSFVNEYKSPSTTASSSTVSSAHSREGSLDSSDSSHSSHYMRNGKNGFGEPILPPPPPPPPTNGFKNEFKTTPIKTQTISSTKDSNKIFDYTSPYDNHKSDILKSSPLVNKVMNDLKIDNQCNEKFNDKIGNDIKKSVYSNQNYNNIMNKRNDILNGSNKEKIGFESKSTTNSSSESLNDNKKSFLKKTECTDQIEDKSPVKLREKKRDTSNDENSGKRDSHVTTRPISTIASFDLVDGTYPICNQCNKQITRGPFITALGRIWCPDHFVCVNQNCRRALQDIGFVEENGQLYCEYCFEQFIAPACDKCHAKIKGDCLNAIGKHFHPECFNCAYCGKLFGNNPFFLEDGLPYCEADWNELFTTKCFACGFPVEAGDRWVEALNNNYHSQCFNCTMCKKNLEGQSFFAKGGRPFCKNHAR